MNAERAQIKILDTFELPNDQASNQVHTLPTEEQIHHLFLAYLPLYEDSTSDRQQTK
jgi:hypothetical protein